MKIVKSNVVELRSIKVMKKFTIHSLMTMVESITSYIYNLYFIKCKNNYKKLYIYIYIYYFVVSKSTWIGNRMVTSFYFKSYALNDPTSKLYKK